MKRQAVILAGIALVTALVLAACSSGDTEQNIQELEPTVLSASGTPEAGGTAEISTCPEFNGSPASVEPTANPSGSDSGGVFAFSGDNDDIYTINADGSGLKNLTNGQGGRWPRWSPDGTRLAFSGSCGVYVMDADGSNRRQISGQRPDFIDWSPQGDLVAFASQLTDVNEREGIHFIYIIDVNGASEERTAGAATTPNFTWSPDGSQIAYSARTPHSVLPSLGIVSTDGSQQINLFLGDEISIDWPSWSPDGTLIVYEGFHGVYVIGADGSDRTRVTTREVETDFFFKPMWSPDGSRIAYQGLLELYTSNPDGSAKAALIEVSGDLIFGGARQRMVWSADSRQIAVTVGRSDGAWQDRVALVAANGTERTEFVEVFAEDFDWFSVP